MLHIPQSGAKSVIEARIYGNQCHTSSLGDFERIIVPEESCGCSFIGCNLTWVEELHY
jgi:hypothetical protein